MACEEDIVTNKNLGIFMNSLDEKSRKIFWYFRYHGHTRLAELTSLIGASADMEVLYRLREVINPTAVKIFGRPLLEFNESRVDFVSGEKILFNWWLTDFVEDNHSFTEEGQKPLVDIFDEEDHILIISEISPSITVSDSVKVEKRNGILNIRLDKLQ